MSQNIDLTGNNVVADTMTVGGVVGPSIYSGSGAPAFSAVKGSLYTNTTASAISTRVYVNNGTTNWIALTTAS